MYCNLVKSICSSRNAFISLTRSQLMKTQQRMSSSIESVMIVGSGLMGSGVATSCALTTKFKYIHLQDVQEKQLDVAKEKIKQNLLKMKQKNATIDENEILKRITFSTSMKPAETKNLLVIEAITEVLNMKQELFKKLCDLLAQDESVIFATNTSSLSCKDISVHVPCKNRFGGLHFFNPVHLMKLVEVIRLDDGTDDKTYNALMSFSKDINKVPITCKDTPGFVVNRLLVPYMMEAVKMLERGDASAKDIDTAMKLGAGYPMGPFELLDYVGLDTSKHITDAWSSAGNTFIQKSALVDEMVNKGWFGKKSGRGFYDYSKK